MIWQKNKLYIKPLIIKRLKGFRLLIISIMVKRLKKSSINIRGID